MTRPIRRSPRLAMPSAKVAAGSCQRSVAPLLRRSSRSIRTLRCSSSTPFWPNHWNGVCAFGHEAAHRRGAARLLRVLPADAHDLAGEVRDAERVVVHLGRDADEEVELHPLPTLRVGALDRREQVVVGDQLVDHLADPPRAALGCEREPGAAHLLDLAGDPDGERVDPQRRQREPDVAAALLLVHEPGDEPVDAREVGRRQRRERDLVVAGAAQAVAHHRAHLVGRALAHRAGDHPRLAEPAAAGAAAEHLDVEAVVDDLDQRDELLLRVRPLGEVGDGALVDRRRARRRTRGRTSRIAGPSYSTS